MKIRVHGGDAASVTADLIVVPVAMGEQNGRALRALRRGQGATGLAGAIAAARFRGREGQTLTLPLGGSGRRMLCLVGLGEAPRLDLDAWRRAAGRGRGVVDALGARRVALVVDERAADREHLTALVEGFRLAGYRFAKYKATTDAPPAIDDLVLVVPSVTNEASLRPDWKALDVAVAAVDRVRDLVNEPAAVKTPSHLAAVAEELGRGAGVAVEVWRRKRIEAEGLTGLLAVARGTHEEPRFIRMRYAGRGARRRIALVGKGITFDSGGLSLKPAKSMENMKGDVAGGAAVIAVMAAIGRLGLPVEVEGFVPATENLPGGAAQKPGDVIRFRNGKTVEVLNTDAEGRLILADALALAASTKPDAIVDVATLTGACVIALGHQVAGVFANHPPLADQLVTAGTAAGESLWPMPLVAEYRDDIKSAVADLKNVGGGSAGSITAALFLQEFVDGVHWAHLDIAGPAFAEKEGPYGPKGGTGFGVRTLLRYLQRVAREESS